jgi:hypothetical protein
VRWRPCFDTPPCLDVQGFDALSSNLGGLGLVSAYMTRMRLMTWTSVACNFQSDLGTNYCDTVADQNLRISSVGSFVGNVRAHSRPERGGGLSLFAFRCVTPVLCIYAVSVIGLSPLFRSTCVLGCAAFPRCDPQPSLTRDRD